MTKAELITWLAGLPDGAAELARVAAICRGTESLPPEPWLNLRDLSKAVSMDRTWLHRLGVPQACGHKIAGGRRYRASEVETYLKSAACKARVARLREERQVGRATA